MEKVAPFDLEVQVHDIFWPLDTAISRQRQTDKVFKKYDTDGSQRISVKEMAPLVKDFLAFELTAKE